ncbi:MAG TPA: ACP S-malonyltransferase [Candidatus Limnocylindrales bacterium]|nr:ACP S-malonyltransferase [Candidatus Limnocylindrales bacterium]
MASRSIALVFPGQGSQAVGMCQALVATSPAAARVFLVADDALGEPISRLAFDGPEDELNKTENAQPALLAASIAYLAALRERWAAAAPGPEREVRFVAGHSMGQYSALVAAESLDLADAVRLVRERGRLMQASGSGREGRMAAIIGLPEDRVDDLIERASPSGLVTVANRNSPGQIVISGERAAIDAALPLAKELGARRAVELPVSVASHSPLMAEAADALQAVLADVTFADPRPPLRANSDGHVIDHAAAARNELVDHLTSGVDWVAVVEALVTDGVTTFVEVGPGRVLTGLIKRIAPDAEALATDDPSAVDHLFVPSLTTG